MQVEKRLIGNVLADKAHGTVAQQTMDLIAERCPILIQLSTGVGLDVPFDERAALVELRPRMATLNPCSMSFGRGEFRNPPAEPSRSAQLTRNSVSLR